MKTAMIKNNHNNNKIIIMIMIIKLIIILLVTIVIIIKFLRILSDHNPRKGFRTKDDISF